MLQEFHVRLNRRAAGDRAEKTTFWVVVAAHYARNKPAVGPERPARSLETKWGDLKASIAKFVGCYEHIKALDESGRTDDDIIFDALQLFEQKVGRPFAHKHCWLLLRDHPRFAAIFRSVGSKRKALGTQGSDLPIDRREANSPELQPREGVDGNVNLHMPQGGKSAKGEHKEMRKKETALRANARATAEFAQATLKKAEQIAQQNAFSLFTLEDSLITCKVTRRWFLLRREQELKRLEKEIAVEEDSTSMVAGDAAAPTAGVRVYTPTIPRCAAAPTAHFAPSSTPLSPSPPLQPDLNVGATVGLSNDEDEDEEDEDEGSDSEAAHRHRYHNSESNLYMQSALKKARAHQDSYDRLGGHFDVSAEDLSDIHVVSDTEGEEMFRVPPSQRRRTGENPNHEAQFLEASKQVLWNETLDSEYASRNCFAAIPPSMPIPPPIGSHYTHMPWAAPSPWQPGARVL
jgi:hypothetical protein